MKLKLIATLAVMSCSIWAGILPEKTAMFYTAAYSKFINKEIVLTVTHVQPNIREDKKLKKGVRCFTAFTSYVNRKTKRISGGGAIKVYIPDNMLIDFLKRYGLLQERTEPKKGKPARIILKNLNCVLKYGDDDGLYVIPTDFSTKSPFKSAGEDLFNAKLTSSASGLSKSNKRKLLKYITKLSTTDEAPEETED
ncbi:MAG: hypothetical protein KAG98_07720 [Lentisphaeria bacterium]|nr:hypothetical protein [Lentisphaeria bacterium]